MGEVRLNQPRTLPPDLKKAYIERINQISKQKGSLVNSQISDIDSQVSQVSKRNLSKASSTSNQNKNLHFSTNFNSNSKLSILGQTTLGKIHWEGAVHWDSPKSLESDKQIINNLFQSKMEEIKNNNLNAIKISRNEVAGLKNSYSILKEGTLLRHFQTKDIKGNIFLDKKEGLIGEGGLKLVKKMFDPDGYISHVLGVMKDPNRKDIIATNIEISKEFHSTPCLLTGSYVQWTNSKGVQKEGFISPFMDIDLHEFIKEEGGYGDFPNAPEDFNLLKGMSILSEVTQGLKSMHDKNWAHFDIKPENILLKDENAYVTDFDCATRLQDNVSNRLAGTPGYIAPELLSQTCIGIEGGKKADIYSLGVTFNSLIDPFMEINEVQNNTEKAELRLSREVKQLVREMTHLDPNARPSIDEVLTRLGEITLNYSNTMKK